MSITICDTHLTRTVRYLSLTFEPVYIDVCSQDLNFINHKMYLHYIKCIRFHMKLQLESYIVLPVSFCILSLGKLYFRDVKVVNNEFFSA